MHTYTQNGSVKNGIHPGTCISIKVLIKYNVMTKSAKKNEIEKNQVYTCLYILRFVETLNLKVLISLLNNKSIKIRIN